MEQKRKKAQQIQAAGGCRLWLWWDGATGRKRDEEERNSRKEIKD